MLMRKVSAALTFATTPSFACTGISLNAGSLTANCPEAEKHSFKLSGMGGSRMGPAGFTRFFRKKALIYQTGAPPSIDSIAERLAKPAT